MKVTHGFEIGEVLVHLGVAEDGVTLTHPPQHSLEGLHLHSLDETRHKAAVVGGDIRLELKFISRAISSGSGFVDINGSPQFGSQSLHAGASGHGVCLHGGEFFILGTKSLMLVTKKRTFDSDWHGSTHKRLLVRVVYFSRVLLLESGGDAEKLVVN